MIIIRKSEKTPRLKAAGVIFFCGIIFAAIAGCPASLYGDTSFSDEPVMSLGSQRGMKIIPLSPPFSKGEISFPPLEKGGEGGFERLFSSEKKLNKLPPSSYVRDVPFFPGEEYQCGPSVLASALNYLGYDIRPEDISGEIYLSNVKGTLNIDMVSFAGRFEDITVTELQGDITLLRENLSMGYPLIVFVDLGIWSIRKGHYMLVVGYDDSREGVIVYSGAERDKVIRYEDFMRIWKRGSYWTLRITKR